jgi:uncharacterized protein
VDRWDVAGTVFGSVSELWRYPVKSLQGEALPTVALTNRGLYGDRSFGIFERSSNVLLSAKRLPKLLEGSAVLVSEGLVSEGLASKGLASDEQSNAQAQQTGLAANQGLRFVAELTFNGTVLRSDDPKVHEALSSWLELDVELRQPTAGNRSVVEMQVDLDDDTQLAEFSTRPGALFDGCSLNLLSTTSLAAARALYSAGAWGVERFRPNIVIETEAAIVDSSLDEEGRPGFVDDELVGFVVSIGGVEATVMKRSDRCVMITRPFGAYPRDRALLRTLTRFHGNELGIDAMVKGSGRVSTGDPIVLVRRT